MEEDEVFKIQPYKQSELARMYNMSVPTFKKMVEPFSHKIGKPTGHFYMPRQVYWTFRLCGVPCRSFKR
jgi:hypothetical protein